MYEMGAMNTVSSSSLNTLPKSPESSFGVNAKVLGRARPCERCDCCRRNCLDSYSDYFPVMWKGRSGSSGYGNIMGGAKGSRN